MKRVSNFITELNKIDEGFEFDTQVLSSSYICRINPRVKECLWDVLKPIHNDSLITERKEIGMANKKYNEPLMTFETFIEQRNHN